MILIFCFKALGKQL